MNKLKYVVQLVAQKQNVKLFLLLEIKVFVISICHYQLRQIAPNIFVLVTNICHSSCLTVTFAAVAPWLSFHLTLTHVH